MTVSRWRLALLLAPALLLVGTLFVGGLVAAVKQSLGDQPLLGRPGHDLDAYRTVVSDPAFVDSLLQTLWIATASTVVSTSLSIGLALALRHRRLGGTTVLLQLPVTVPHLLAAVGIAMIVSQSGLGSRLAAALGLVGEPRDFPALLYDPWSIGVILTYVWKEVPFMTLVVLAALRSRSTELEEAARTLGAGRWQRVRHVVLPEVAPSVVAASLVVFAFTFGAFEVPYLLGRTYPGPLSVTAWNAYRDIDPTSRPVAMAINVLVAAVTVVLAAVYLRLARRTGHV